MTFICNNQIKCMNWNVKFFSIIFNIFMLDDSAQLMGFVDKMTRVSRGRVFYTTSESLGQYIVMDYLSNRRRVIK